MKFFLFFFVQLLGFAACDTRAASLYLLQGAWTGSVRNGDLTVLKGGGGVGPLCRDSLPPDCAKEVPKGSATYTINGTKLSLLYTHLSGVTTLNAPAELMPSCAAAGIYPIHFELQIPPSEIVSYNIFSGRLNYEDPRRLGECNCVVLRYRHHWIRPYVSVQQRITFYGSLKEVFTRGPHHCCDCPPPKCNVTMNPVTGVLNLVFYDEFKVERGSDVDVSW